MRLWKVDLIISLVCFIIVAMSVVIGVPAPSFLNVLILTVELLGLGVLSMAVLCRLEFPDMEFTWE